MPTEDIGKAYPDACTVCEGDRSTKKNPILYCDGKGCNLPVHKICYGVDKVPSGEWLCQQCESTKKKRPTHVLCCPFQTGALRHTMIPGEFMHILCAMWNKKIDHKIEPYGINKSHINVDECHLCTQKQGLCIQCEEPTCQKRFHVTCAINQGLIAAAPNVPESYSPRCAQHQSESIVKLRHYASKRGKLIKRRVQVTSEEDDDEKDEFLQDADSDTSEESTTPESSTKQTSSSSSRPFTKRPSTAHHQKGNEITLFLSEQSNSEDDMGTRPKAPRLHLSDSEDDMGTHSKKAVDGQGSDSEDDMGTSRRHSRSFVHVRPQHARENGNGTDVNAGPYGLTLRERLDAKRKKTVEATKPNIPSVPNLAVERPKAPPTLPLQPFKLKQKLPNKAHLAIPTKTPPLPTSTPPPPNMNGPKKMSLSTTTPFVKDMEEIRTGGPKWTPSGPITPLTHATHSQLTSQIATPLSPFEPTSMPFQRPLPTVTPRLEEVVSPLPGLSKTPESQTLLNEIQHQQLVSVVSTMLREALSTATNSAVSSTTLSTTAALQQEQQRYLQENIRLRAEADRFQTFKKNVADVFGGLQFSVPSLEATPETIEGFVVGLKEMLARSGPISEQEVEQINKNVDSSKA
ncbi:hypothetical protein BDF14DRAFT_1820768 [Spinellus fusiger]|nr:hypothetical protein BDF14DRAFT_1820768 [Spinellus fusiger]